MYGLVLKQAAKIIEKKIKFTDLMFAWVVLG